MRECGGWVERWDALGRRRERQPHARGRGWPAQATTTFNGDSLAQTKAWRCSTYNVMLCRIDHRCKRLGRCAAKGLVCACDADGNERRRRGRSIGEATKRFVSTQRPASFSILSSSHSMAPNQHLHSPRHSTDDIVEVSPPKAPRLEQPDSRPHTSTNSNTHATRSQSSIAMPPPATCIASAAGSPGPAAAARSPDPQTSSSPTHQHATRSSSCEQASCDSAFTRKLTLFSLPTAKPAQPSPRQTARAPPSSSAPGPAPISVEADVTNQCLALAKAGKWENLLYDTIYYSTSTNFYSSLQYASDLAATVTAWHAVAQLVLGIQ